MTLPIAREGPSSVNHDDLGKVHRASIVYHAARLLAVLG
jgi:hypothetical protein